jgi:hypothetical protein
MGGNTVEQPRDGGPSERQPYGRLYFLGVIGVKRVTCSSIVRSALSFISRRTAAGQPHITITGRAGWTRKGGFRVLSLICIHLLDTLKLVSH